MYKLILLFFLLTTSVFAQNLTAINITEGEYAGYKALKGYEDENLYQVYFKGNSESYVVTHENLKKVNMDEVFTFEYKGEKRQSTRKQLYKLFNESSKLQTFKNAQDDREFSQTWFSKTFGQVYQDWFDDQLYSQEAYRLVEKYFRQNEPPINRFQTADIKIEN